MFDKNLGYYVVLTNYLSEEDGKYHKEVIIYYQENSFPKQACEAFIAILEHDSGF